MHVSSSLLNLSKVRQDKSRVYIRPGCGGGGLSSQNCTLSHITSDQCFDAGAGESRKFLQPVMDNLRVVLVIVGLVAQVENQNSIQ